ncbi:hypothetical protein AC1031_009347 [Aphanomyces cochlioides]|nr:hypothetical protein AC1031_009323 [Aphanomyces cochlioides]KAG9401484.1 hypothetical protein AC1031_009347 [Aphanomyces cochlioides]
MPLVSKLTTPDGVSSVVQDLQSLNLLFVQLASRNSSKVLLTQPIIPNSGDPWSPFGWMTLYDWVDGTREAYAFEGDAGSLSLMSARSANLPVASNPLELPRTACVPHTQRSVNIKAMDATFFKLIASLAVSGQAVLCCFYEAPQPFLY